MSSTGRALIAAICLSSTPAIVSCSSNTSSADVLDELLARHQAHDGLVIDYDATGTAVLDCMLPNRSFRVTANTRSGDLEASDPATGEPILVRTGDAVFIHGRLTTPRLADATWWRIDDPDIESLTRVLGADLAGAAMAPPSDGNDIVNDAISSGADIAHGDDADHSFKIAVAGDQPGSSGLGLDITVSLDGVVTQVTATQIDDPTDGGFRLRFQPVGPAPRIAQPDAADVATVDVKSLSSAPIPECELGDSTPDDRP